MSTIHYFPRYSQKENMVTNNTLLLFSRLYNNSPDKFRRFINALLEDSGIELDTTVRFKQQEKGNGSIPDGLIEQESFKIIIETKLYGQEHIHQIKNHWKAFDNEDKQIFLWINKKSIAESYEKKIIDNLNKFNDEHKTDIGLSTTTFKDICKCFNEILLEYDIEMRTLIEDYESFCNETGLLDNADTKIRVVLAGQTLQQNIQNNIYYNPADRGYQNTKYLGLYKNKAVRAIGEINCIVDAKYDVNTGDLIIDQVVSGTLAEQQEATIKKVVIEAKNKFGYILDEGRRYFFVEKYIKTEYLKKSKGGLMGTRYINLEEVDGYQKDMTVEEIAELLKDNDWNIG